MLTGHASCLRCMRKQRTECCKNTDNRQRNNRLYKTFQDNGKIEVIEKDVDGKKCEFYKLKTADGAGDIIFKKVDDNTLRMVNNEFKEAESKLNYDLKKK